MPTGNIPEAPELGTPCYKEQNMLAPNGVCYREVTGITCVHLVVRESC